jgi:hypothetical protein
VFTRQGEQAKGAYPAVMAALLVGENSIGIRLSPQPCATIRVPPDKSVLDKATLLPNCRKPLLTTVA